MFSKMPTKDGFDDPKLKFKDEPPVTDLLDKQVNGLNKGNISKKYK